MATETVQDDVAQSGSARKTPHVRVAIVGTGFSGLGLAIQLKQRGMENFVILERADDVGGTWRDNTYPGCACDVPSHLYSFSFARNPDWSDTFSGQAEIWAYLRACVDRFGVAPHLRLGHAVIRAAWDDEARLWRIDTSRGRYTARVLVAGNGPLSDPALPDLPGLDTFAGTTFHSARWRHDHDLAGRRVAVIGTGASAVQFVPKIAPQVEALTVFQRTAAWVMPRRSRRISGFERAVYRYVPGAQRLVRTSLYWAREAFAFGFLRPRVMRRAQRIAEHHMHRQVPDPGLRAKIMPSYLMGCKRVVLSSDYLPALARDNVDVVTSPIAEVRPHAMVTADGVEHPVDTIIFGTGFHVTDSPIASSIVGAHGRTLAEAWSPTMRAYLGQSVTGFPNLFMLLGPNTGLGHTSVVLMVEAQIAQLVKALRYMATTGRSAIEPTPAAQEAFVAEVDRRMAPTVWATGGCKSWYLDSTGRNSTLWPGFVTGYRLRTRRFRPGDYRPVAASPTRAHQSSGTDSVGDLH
jgi:cation diffusion facilitator CzcD-associated flavoprotein CzcO